MAAATLSQVKSRVGKLADVITLTGTNFADAPSKTKVYKRKHGDTAWDTVTASNVTYVSATEITVTLASGDAFDGGMNDIGVSVSTESAPEAYLEQALQFYTAGSDDADNVVVGPPDGVYVGGVYSGDFADAVKLTVSEELKKIFTQHSRYPVQTYPGEASAQLDLPLAEFTPENASLLFGSTATPTDLGSGRKRISFGGRTALTYQDVMLICPGPTGYKVAVGLYRCALSASGEITWGKDENAKLPVKIEILADTARGVGDQLGFMEWMPVA